MQRLHLVVYKGNQLGSMIITWGFQILCSVQQFFLAAVHDACIPGRMDLSNSSEVSMHQSLDISGIHQLLIRAGKEILSIYETSFAVSYKEDSSPVTLADRISDRMIRQELQESFPVISEESVHEAYEKRKNWDHYWLVDPLDGTKEFIRRNGEFSINIAFMEGDTPRAGFVYAPVLDELFWGVIGEGAWKLAQASAGLERQPMTLTSDGKLHDPLRVITSRSHMTPETEAYIERLQERYGAVTRIASGSGLKLCRVAEGTADVYPRFSRTMEWDFAAGEAICRSCGCFVVNAQTRKPLTYNKEDLHNPWVLAGRDERLLDVPIVR